MSPVPGRRTFVRTVAAGVPALAGLAALSPAAHALSIIPAQRPFAPHPGIDGALHRLAALHNELLHRQPTPSDLRTAVEQLRRLVSYRLESNRDGELSAALQRLIATHGRQALLTMPPDCEVLQTGLAAYGVTVAHLDIGAPTLEARGQALDVLAQSGATSYYVTESMILDALASLVNYDPGACRELRDVALASEAAAAVICSAAAFFPPLAVECFALSMIVAFVKIMQVLSSC